MKRYYFLFMIRYSTMTLISTISAKKTWSSNCEPFIFITSILLFFLKIHNKIEKLLLRNNVIYYDTWLNSFVIYLILELNGGISQDICERVLGDLHIQYIVLIWFFTSDPASETLWRSHSFGKKLYWRAQSIYIATKRKNKQSFY